ncbi:MAG: GGDEF domain-containing protein [Ruminococcus sp.]|nr:GGDEF domain-containing protein [Ruminococcus sp.]
MSDNKIKEIVVIVAGIDEEYQNEVLEGIIDCAKVSNINISCFSAFGGVMTSSLFDIGEYNIYELINYEKFDGAVLLTNTISDPVEREKIIAKVKASGIPTTVLDCDDYPEFYNISIDNSEAMREIVRHVICCHNAKTINYISGPLANPEAADRYKAYLDVMKEYGREADDSRVFFGEFRAIDGVHGVEAFIDSGMPMPDAIICANDVMALAAVTTLEKYGYQIPGDVIVTGFDNTYNARHYCPALTTVSRPLREAGFKACELIVKLIAGEKFDKEIVLKSAPLYSESCGCSSADDSAMDIKEYKKSAFRLINQCRVDISILNRMTSKLAEIENADENIAQIGKFIAQTGCRQYSICLCSEWEGAFKDSWSHDGTEEYQIHGYTKKMSAPYIWDNGKVSSVSSFESRDMYPKPFETGGNISYFLPLHFRERCLGYYILSNGDFPTKSLVCHSMLMNVSNSIENIRKLIHLNSVIEELDKLYVIDPLCGIYNRNGFIRNADTLYRKCADEGIPLLISFIDMDGLKMINDNYGHKEGDFALQRLASIINECSRGGKICARFGGDEFIIFGAGASADDIEPFELSFRKHLEMLNKIIDKPYKIDASIGTLVTKVEQDTKLFALISQADQIMYERKKRKKTSRYLRK